MTIAKYVFTLLIAIALLPAGASVSEPKQNVVESSQNSATIVIKGVRDPSTWFRIESQHLIVYSDSDPEQAVQLVKNLERLDYVLRLYLRPFLIRQPDLPKLTLYFQDRVNWTAELGEFPVETVGLVDSCVSGTQVFTFGRGRMWESNNASLLTDNVDFTLSAILTLYSENFLYRHTEIRGPEWFLQGFKFYFGGARFTDNQMAIGHAAGTTAESMKLLDYSQGRLYFLTYDEVLRKDMSQDFFSRMKKTEIGTDAYLAQAEFQSRAFNLVHYMLSTAENRDKMARYLELMNNGSDGGAAFADLFGLSGMKLNATMWHYRRVLMKVIKVDFPELPMARIDFTRLSRVEGDFVLDNAALKACPSPDNGGKLLRRVRAAAAAAHAVDFAQITMSRAEIEWGDPRDAIPYLTDALRHDSRNVELHYLLGLAHLKLAKNAVGDKREQLAEARTSLTEAALLAPGTPWISYALFHVGIMDSETPPEKTMDLASKAWRQGHDVAAFARAAALAYAWLGDSASAYRALNTLAKNDHDPNSAAWAVQWLKLFEKGVTRDHLLTALRDEPLASPGFRRMYGDAR
ncbi:tetratricopeptide repeat protein [Oxalobacteraceae bacterium OTU3CAMAD1]|nr:tetratricopeptide repeat protein [Oxalobacteraceae bacterium OTU3CAMAD1]